MITPRDATEFRLDGAAVIAATPDDLRAKAAEYLTTLLTAEHVSILVGSGFPLALSSAVTAISSAPPPSMARPLEWPAGIAAALEETSRLRAQRAGRGSANIEDRLTIAFEVESALQIMDPTTSAAVLAAADSAIRSLLSDILANERAVVDDLSAPHIGATFLSAIDASRRSRDRLHVFTTNYDRLLELCADRAGLRVIDRFSGEVEPRLRAPSYEIDWHYVPSSTRVRARKLDGVVRLTKLHGSVDWVIDHDGVRRQAVPLGADITAVPTDMVAIFPRSVKALETALYPYADLFRDFQAAVCRPESVLITYGYGFGDSHVNQVIRDMLSIGSSRLVVISRDNLDDRLHIMGADAQASVIYGEMAGLSEVGRLLGDRSR